MSKKGKTFLVKWLQTTYNTVSNSGIKSLFVGPKQHGSTQRYGYEPWLIANKSWQLCLPQGSNYAVCLWFSVIYVTCCFTVLALLNITIPTSVHKSTRGMYILKIQAVELPIETTELSFININMVVCLPASRQCKHAVNTRKGKTQRFKHTNRNRLIWAQRTKVLIKTLLLWPATYVPLKAEECGYSQA